MEVPGTMCRSTPMLITGYAFRFSRLPGQLAPRVPPGACAGSRSSVKRCVSSRITGRSRRTLPSGPKQHEHGEGDRHRAGPPCLPPARAARRGRSAFHRSASTCRSRPSGACAAAAGMIMSMRWPTASASVQPNRRAAAAFQTTTRPSASLTIRASPIASISAAGSIWQVQSCSVSLVLQAKTAPLRAPLQQGRAGLRPP